MVEISEDEELQGWYDEEEHQRKVRNSIISTGGIRKGWEKAVEEGREKGIKEGKKEGMREGIKQTAVNMLRKGIDIKVIAEVTGLSLKELEMLKKDD